MKKLLLTVACVLATISTYAQGTVNFANVGVGLNAPVFDVDGTTKLEGAGFMAQLYAGADANSLVAVAGATTFLTGANAGFFVGGTKAVPGIDLGAAGTFQVRAWDAAGGGTYEAALAAGAKAGLSGTFTVTTGGGGIPANPPATLVGLTSFNLTQVPEPSTIALGLLGAAGLLIRRRK
jgi:hypothetical protein